MERAFSYYTKIMQLRFKFENTEAGIREFFEKEFKELLESLSLLMIVGTEIDRIDLDNRVILLKPITEKVEEPVVENEKIEQNRKVCETCIFFKEAINPINPGICNHHKYTTLANDTCKQWTQKT